MKLDDYNYLRCFVARSDGRNGSRVISTGPVHGEGMGENKSKWTRVLFGMRQLAWAGLFGCGSLRGVHVLLSCGFSLGFSAGT